MDNKIILGIDFGTTNTCVSYFDKELQKVVFIPNYDGNYTIPTNLFFNTESDEILYGLHYENMLNYNTINHTICNIKQLIGIKTPTTRNENYMECPNTGYLLINILYNNIRTKFSIIELVSIYLNFIIRNCKEYLKISSITDIVITVPAYFSDIQRQFIKTSCEMINLNVIRIINEPTSAALAYAYTLNVDHVSGQGTLNVDTHVSGQGHVGGQNITQTHENILVIDCGGGTTDFSLLSMDYEDSFYEVINICGDNNLGGDDLTNNLINYILEKLKISNPSLKQMFKLRKQSTIAKHQLSYLDNTTVYLESFIEDRDISIPLSRTLFIQINNDFFKKIKNYIIQVTENDKDTLDKIILVGGTTRIPIFKDICKEIFNDKVFILDSIDPDKTVSMGASIQGALLNNLISTHNNFNEIILLDVLPMTIGIETMGGLMTSIISKNTNIPVSKTEVFLNSEDIDENGDISIDIYQGERRFVKDNFLIGSFKLNVNKQLKKGELKIQMIFEIDQNCNMFIKAKTDSVSNSISTHINMNIINNEICDLDKLLDSDNASKILAKIELVDSFKYFSNVFQDKKNHLDTNTIDVMKKLLLSVSDTINNYDLFSSVSIKESRKDFEKKWHFIMNSIK
jgi:molecular chaperone DnaK (HSP70)